MKFRALLLAMTMGLISMSVGYGQAQTAKNVAAVKPAETTTPVVTDSDMLKLRNIQVDLQSRVIAMQDLQGQYAKLQGEREQLEKQVSQWVNEQAAKQQVDLTKFYFDFQTAKFVEKPPEKPKQ